MNDSWYAIPQIRKAIRQYKDIEVIQTKWDGTIIIRYKSIWYTLTDNGGEVNVEKINSPELRPFPTVDSKDGSLNTETLMYRLFKVLNGEEIDYQHRESDYLK